MSVICVKSTDNWLFGNNVPTILTVPVGWSLIGLTVILKVISWVIDVIEVSVDAVTMIVDNPL